MADPTDPKAASDRVRAVDDRLTPVVYAELRDLAGRCLNGERRGHTLQPTALVHEAYLRLARERQMQWQSPEHFKAIAARAMRQILINHARARGAAKRGGDAQRLSITLGDIPDELPATIPMLELEDALQALAALDERHARVVELRFFGGLTVDETAAVLDVSPRTVEADWAFARAWLRSHMEGTRAS